MTDLLEPPSATPALPTLPRRREIIAAVRNGTVPGRGLEHLSVGLTKFESAIDEELARVALGNGGFKAVRGEYGAGKTFFSRWVQHRAQALGFATAEVQISGSETPLHRWETVYRRALENLRTQGIETGVFRGVIDRWFLDLERDAESSGITEPAALVKAVEQRLEASLAGVRDVSPMFATVLRAVYRARVAEDTTTEDGLLGWLMAQPNISVAVKKAGDVSGQVDGTTAAGLLRGFLALLRATGRKGLVLVLDEVETIQRMRADLREQSLDGVRKIIDDIDHGRFPGLYVLMTGTPAFFDGPQGVKRLPPLEQRLYQDFRGDPRFDSAKATQIRLLPFDLERLVEAGRRVRALYPAKAPARVLSKVDDDMLRELASGVIGKLGGKVGVAPRLYLRKLVGELLDKVDEHEDYEPREHFQLLLDARELSAEERNAAGIARTVDDIALDLNAVEEEEPSP